MSKRLRLLLIILILIPLLTSCWNAEELDKMSYIHSMGIDYKNGEYRVYIQMVNFAFLTNQAAPSSQAQTQAVVGFGKGKTIVDAIRDVYKNSSRRDYWGHLSSVIFTENGLKHGLNEALDLFSRYHEIRYSLWLYSTKEPLNDVLTTFPPTEISEVYAKLGDPRDALKQSSFIKPMRMFEFIRELYEPGSTVVIPRLSIGRDKWYDGKKTSNSLTMANASVLTENNYEGDLTNKHAKGLLFFEQAPRFFVYVNIEDHEDVTLTFSKPKVKIIPHYKNHHPTFDFNVKAKAIIEEVDAKIPLNTLQKKSEKHITSLINDTYTTALKKDMDIYNLSHAFYVKYPKIWHKIQDKGKIPLDKDSLNIKINLKLINTYKSNYKPFMER